jgi:probable HAF family extracellular repeat protein
MYRTSPCVSWFVSTLLWASALSWAADPVPIAYTLTDLGPVLSVNAIAPDSLTTGGSVTLNREQAAAQFAPTPVTIGQLPEGHGSRVNGAAGTTLVGYGLTGPPAFAQHAFVYTPDGGLVDLGTLDAASLDSAATGLNSAGTIVGYGTDAADHLVALVWEDGQVRALPPLAPTKPAWAMAINAWGAIVGYAATATNADHAVLWSTDGGVEDLHTLDGSMSFAMAVNDVGQVVGYGLTSAGWRGWVWLPFTGMLPLAPLPGDTLSRAWGLNDAGLIVGQSVASGPEANTDVEHAVRWVNGQPEDLNAWALPGFTLTRAVGINQHGVIAVECRVNGELHGCLLTPQPAVAHRHPHKRHVRVALAKGH